MVAARKGWRVAGRKTVRHLGVDLFFPCLGRLVGAVMLRHLLMRLVGQWLVCRRLICQRLICMCAHDNVPFLGRCGCRRRAYVAVVKRWGNRPTSPMKMR